MKKISPPLFLILFFFAAGTMVPPAHAEDPNDFNLIALQYQLNKAKMELSRLLPLQTAEAKRELTRLKREIEQIRREIDEELKKEKITLAEEDRNLKKYLVQYKFVVERLKIDIDTALKIEKVQTQAENASLKTNISESKTLLKNILSGNAITGKLKVSPTKPFSPHIETSSSADVAKPITTAINKAPLPKKQDLVTVKKAEASENLNKKTSPGVALGEMKDIEKKMTAYGDDIKNIKETLTTSSGNLQNTWVALGKANLESERYLKSLKPEDRYKLVHEDQYAVGSHAIAILSFKRALTLNPGDADLHYLLGETYDEMKDGRSASDYSEWAKRFYAKNGDHKMVVKANEYAQSLRKKYTLYQEHGCNPAETLC